MAFSRPFISIVVVYAHPLMSLYSRLSIVYNNIDPDSLPARLSIKECGTSTDDRPIPRIPPWMVILAHSQQFNPEPNQEIDEN